MLKSINDNVRYEVLKDNYKKYFEDPGTVKKLSKETIKLLISDSLKVSFLRSNKKKDFTINSSIDNLVNKFLNNKYFMYEVINDACVFNNIPDILKIEAFEEIKDFSKERLFYSLSKTYVLDSVCYSFYFDLDSIQNYYKNYMQILNTDNDSKDVTKIIIENLNNYKEINKKEYEAIILNVLLEYYKWSLFLKNNLNRKINEEYLSIISNYSIEDLFNYIYTNKSFLNEIMENYLKYTTLYTHIDRKEVEAYYNNNVNDNIKQKLKIKN